MTTSQKDSIPEDQLSQEASSYIEDCLLEGATWIDLKMEKDRGSGKWTLTCSSGKGG